jgi:hypothetical protein
MHARMHAHTHTHTRARALYLLLYTTRNSDLYDHNTRRKDDFNVPNCNMSINVKCKLKLFLLDYPFYTLHKFLSEGQHDA